MRGDGNPFLGVPGGAFTVENPDGVFDASGQHSLYDKQLVEPTIPGDFDSCRDVPFRTKD